MYYLLCAKHLIMTNYLERKKNVFIDKHVKRKESGQLLWNVWENQVQWIVNLHCKMHICMNT